MTSDEASRPPSFLELLAGFFAFGAVLTGIALLSAPLTAAAFGFTVFVFILCLICFVYEARLLWPVWRSTLR